MTMISIAQPQIGEEEIRAVNEVLESGMLAQGPKVAQLEADFAAYCGTKFAVAVNSGTAAIHAALYAAGVREGDEVITVPFSFIATINPILMLGAKPVLVDIDPRTYNMDVGKVEALITDKTKAILPVHLYGQPVDFAKLNTIASARGIKIIEDACQAIGAEYDGRRAGSLGDMGCFSLYATKNIMCGEGGMITTDDEDAAVAMRQFRQHGMSAQYEYMDIGYNYRMSDLHACIAIEQLKKADDFNATRQRNAILLNEGLKGLKGIELPTVADTRTHVFHQYTVRVTEDADIDRAELASKLKENGIGAGVYYPKCLHMFPHIAKYGYATGDFPESERAASQVLALPVHPMVSEADVKRIIEQIKLAMGV